MMRGLWVCLAIVAAMGGAQAQEAAPDPAPPIVEWVSPSGALSLRFDPTVWTLADPSSAEGLLGMGEVLTLEAGPPERRLKCWVVDAVAPSAPGITQEDANRRVAVTRFPETSLIVRPVDLGFGVEGGRVYGPVTADGEAGVLLGVIGIRIEATALRAVGLGCTLPAEPTPDEEAQTLALESAFRLRSLDQTVPSDGLVTWMAADQSVGVRYDLSVWGLAQPNRMHLGSEGLSVTLLRLEADIGQEPHARCLLARTFVPGLPGATQEEAEADLRSRMEPEAPRYFRRDGVLVAEYLKETEAGQGTRLWWSFNIPTDAALLRHAMVCGVGTSLEFDADLARAQALMDGLFFVPAPELDGDPL